MAERLKTLIDADGSVRMASSAPKAILNEGLGLYVRAAVEETKQAMVSARHALDGRRCGVQAGQILTGGLCVQRGHRNRAGH